MDAGPLWTVKDTLGARRFFGHFDTVHRASITTEHDTRDVPGAQRRELNTGMRPAACTGFRSSATISALP